MKKDIKISAIVPVYNMEKYLERCLDSLVNQTLEDIEIIVINDGSKDNSQKIIDKYSKKYKEKIVSYTNKNQGISKTRNFGIDKAKGQFLAFIDSDDFVEKDMFEKMYNKAIKENLDIVVCDYYNYFDKTQTKHIEKIVDFNNTNLLNNLELIFKINPSPWNKIYKRELILNLNYRFPENIKYEDLGYIPILLTEANKIGKINIPYNYYLIRSNSETTTVDKRVYDVFKILDILYDYFKFKKIYNKEEVEYLFINKLTTYNLQQKFNKDKKVKKDFILKSFDYLNLKYPNWKQNKYFKGQNILKYLIKRSKFLTSIYIILGGKHEN
ncbi:MAG: glycosyltransferase family 2 protein [Bacilli bacterium]|nr:glycosyltransferase family 2 protein [Bacilli bacterium]